MASSEQHGGYDCGFVERPQELQTDCPICMVVLREPFQVTCCGNSYCRTCIKLIKAKEKACPTCNEANFSTFPNKGLQRSLYSFRVRCVHQKSGCEWIGELGELDGHLNLNPDLGKQLNGCEFATVACTHCCEYFQRCHVHAHESECPKQASNCQEVEKEKQGQASAIAELQKCSEACRHEIEALKQRVNKDVMQELANLRRQQNKDKHTLFFVLLLCTCFFVFLFFSWSQASEIENLKWKVNELRIQQKESLEESRYMMPDQRGKQAQAAVDNLHCSEASKREIEGQHVVQEVAELKKELKERLEESQHKIQELERDKQASQHNQELEALKRKLNKDMEDKVAKLKEQLKGSLEERQHEMLELERAKQTSQHKKEIEALERKLNKDMENKVATLKEQLKGSLEESQHKILELEREKQTSKQELETLKQKVNKDMEGKVAMLVRQQKEFQHTIQEFESRKRQHRKHCSGRAHRRHH